MRKALERHATDSEDTPKKIKDAYIGPTAVALRSDAGLVFKTLSPEIRGTQSASDLNDGRTLIERTKNVQKEAG